MNGLTRRAAAAIMLALGLGIGLGGLLPAHAATDAAAGFYQKAESHLARREWRAAIIELKNAVQANPDDAAIRAALGSTYLVVGDPASAEKELQFALARGYDPAKVEEPLARAMLLQGKYREMLQVFPAQPDGRGTAAGTLVWRGYAYLGLSRNAEAEQAMTAAIQANPNEAHAQAGLSYVLFSAGKLADAEARVDEALRLMPAMPEALTIKGELRRLAKDNTGALALFAKALDADPGAVLARAGRAAVLIELDQLDRAQQDVDVIRAVAPQLLVGTYLQAVILTHRRDLLAATDLLARNSAALDTYPAALNLLGSLYKAQGQLEQAQSYLGRYLAINGQDLAARKELAGVLIRKGEAAAAIELLLPATSATADSDLFGLLATAYLSNQQPAAAIQWFDRAAAPASQNLATRTRIAAGRLQAGQLDAGVRDLEAIVELDPQQDSARVLLAFADLRAGKLEAAQAEAEQLRPRLAKSPIPDHLLGTILLAKGDVAAARERFAAALQIAPDFAPSQDSLARLDLAAGNLDGARQRYEAMAKADSKSVLPVLALARIAVAQGRADDAEQLLLHAGVTDPRAIEPQVMLVDLYLQRRQVAKALATAQTLQAAVPGSLEAGSAVVRAQLANGEKDGAIATLRQLTALKLTSPQGQHQLARLLLSAGDIAGARDALMDALRLDDGYSPAEIDLVDLDARSGRIEQALASARDWRSRHPDAVGGDLAVAQALSAAGRFAEAAEAFEAAFHREKTTDIAMRWYGAMMMSGKVEEALKGMESWVVAHPGDRPAQLALAGALIESGHHDEAVARYERLVEQNPGDAIALNNLAWLYAERNDGRALDLAERAYKLAPASAEIADTLGYILVRQGDAKRGLEVLSTAHAINGRSPEVTYHLAVALNQTGRVVEARTLLDQLLASTAAFDSRAEAVGLQRTLATR